MGKEKLACYHKGLCYIILNKHVIQVDTWYGTQLVILGVTLYVTMLQFLLLDISHDILKRFELYSYNFPRKCGHIQNFIALGQNDIE